MKVGKSRHTSNVCLVSTDNEPSQPQLIREQEAGMTEGGRVQQESAAPSVTPSLSGNTSQLAHVLSPGRVLGPWRKQVPKASLFPHQAPRKNTTKPTKQQDRYDFSEDVIHGQKECVNERKEVQGGERLKEGSVAECFVSVTIFLLKPETFQINQTSVTFLTRSSCSKAVHVSYMIYICHTV